MIFLITKVYKTHDTTTEYDCLWSLHKTEKGKPGEALCRSMTTWPTERQTRAHINQVKTALSKGARYIKVEVQDVRPDPPEPTGASR